MLPPVDSLITNICSCRDFGAAWAAGAWTPISSASSNKNATVIFGEAIDAQNERMTAERLQCLWKKPQVPEALGGFHAAVTYDSQEGVIVSADLLGIFPIYYYLSDDVLLVGSSPELFRYHPLFEMQLNPEGLVGIFLTKGIFEGQTLLRGVRRLAPGHLLVYDLGKKTKEVLQFEPRTSTRYFDLNLAEQVEILDQAFRQAIHCHLPNGGEYGLMLSGGLDSRVLGGYLSQKNLRVVALTEGLDTDNEMRCATLVAQALRYRHVKFDVGNDYYSRFADLSTTWQHLCDGFTDIRSWGYYPHLRKVATRIITGYFATEILGDLFNYAIPKRATQVSFETFFNFLNRPALRPRILRELVREEVFDELVPKTLRRIRRVYDSYSGLPFQKIWRFGLHHYMRFHVGSVLWPLTFGAWPIMPFADRRVLETVGAMPMEALMNRRAERELLRKKFPALARLPLNGVTYDTTPLVPTSRQAALQILYGDRGIWRFGGARNIRTALLVWLKGNRRYYSRTSHYDSPGWRIVREKAEPSLGLASGFLDKNMVQQLVPKSTSGYARVLMSLKRAGMTDATSLKILLGFALWLEKHPVN